MNFARNCPRDRSAEIEAGKLRWAAVMIVGVEFEISRELKEERKQEQANG